MRQSQGYVKVKVPYLPTLEVWNEMEGLSSKKMGSIKATNNVVRFDYGKVKGKLSSFAFNTV